MKLISEQKIGSKIEWLKSIDDLQLFEFVKLNFKEMNFSAIQKIIVSVSEKVE